MKIKLHPEASKEVAEAVLWYEGQQPSLGKRFADEVEAAIYRIAAFPNINSEISKGLRRGIIPIFPFGIIYSIFDEDIEILAIAHLHRKPFYWKKRIK